MKTFEQVMREHGYTAGTLAAKAGISRQNIYNITNGRSTIGRMGVIQVRKIAHAMGMTIDELLNELESDER